MLLIFAAVITWNAPTWYQQWQAARLASAYRVIDSKLPGTEVYFKDKYLGVAPVILTQADCTQLGLPTNPGSTIETDGWTEGIFIHDSITNTEPRISYKLSPKYLSSYLTYETPWGIRSKINGGQELKNGIRCGFMSRGQDGIGVITEIKLLEKETESTEKLKIQITITNTGPIAFAGYRPEVEILWATLDAPWGSRSHKKFPQPIDWANIAPGQKRQTIVEISRPATRGDYSIFAIFNLFKDESSGYLAGHGSVYSDSKLLQVP